jgi:hypothetical protein
MQPLPRRLQRLLQARNAALLRMPGTGVLMAWP